MPPLSNAASESEPAIDAASEPPDSDGAVPRGLRRSERRDPCAAARSGRFCGSQPLSRHQRLAGTYAATAAIATDAPSWMHLALPEPGGLAPPFKFKFVAWPQDGGCTREH